MACRLEILNSSWSHSMSPFQVSKAHYFSINVITFHIKKPVRPVNSTAVVIHPLAQLSFVFDVQ